MPKVKTKPEEPHLLPMGTYPDVPELDGLKAAAEKLYDMDDFAFLGEKVWLAYKYLFWSRRYQTIPATRDEHTVAIGFVTKYHRLLFGIPITAAEHESIDRAEAAYKARQRS